MASFVLLKAVTVYPRNCQACETDCTLTLSITGAKPDISSLILLQYQIGLGLVVLVWVFFPFVLYGIRYNSLTFSVKHILSVCPLQDQKLLTQRFGKVRFWYEWKESCATPPAYCITCQRIFGLDSIKLWLRQIFRSLAVTSQLCWLFISDKNTTVMAL